MSTADVVLKFLAVGAFTALALSTLSSSLQEQAVEQYVQEHKGELSSPTYSRSSSESPLAGLENTTAKQQREWATEGRNAPILYQSR